MHTKVDKILRADLLRSWLVFLTPILFFFASGLPAQTSETTSPQQIVEQFVGAYNDGNVEGMVKLGTPDIKWMSVTHNGVETVTSNGDELAEALSGFVTSSRDSWSELLSIKTLGQTVTTIEKALWKNAEGETQSQCSIAVYLISDDLINSVWYFPEQPCPQ